MPGTLNNVCIMNWSERMVSIMINRNNLQWKPVEMIRKNRIIWNLAVCLIGWMAQWFLRVVKERLYRKLRGVKGSILKRQIECRVWYQYREHMNRIMSGTRWVSGDSCIKSGFHLTRFETVIQVFLKVEIMIRMQLIKWDPILDLPNNSKLMDLWPVQKGTFYSIYLIKYCRNMFRNWSNWKK